MKSLDGALRSSARRAILADVGPDEWADMIRDKAEGLYQDELYSAAKAAFRAKKVQELYVPEEP